MATPPAQAATGLKLTVGFSVSAVVNGNFNGEGEGGAGEGGAA